MSADARDHLATHIAHEMRGHPDELQLRQVSHYMEADPPFGALLAAKLAQAKARPRLAGSQTRTPLLA